jgi:hypothetical protein
MKEQILMFEYRVLRRTFGLKMDEMTGGGGGGELHNE